MTDLQDEAKKQTVAQKKTNKVVSGSVHSATAQSILHQRAQLLAQTEDKESYQDLFQYLRFQLGSKENYGIPYSSLLNIVFKPKIVSLPSSPDFIVGVLHQHGELLAVLDMKYFLGIDEAYSKDYWVLIVKKDHLKMGFLVDSVIGNDFYTEDQITPPLPSKEIKKIDYIKGILEGQVSMLNMDIIFNDEDILIRT